MFIDGQTRVHFVLGHPVSQVRAPAVFNRIFAAHGVNAVLLPAEVAPQHLAHFVNGAMEAANFGGLWLTIPHKAAVMPLLGRADRLGRRAGAVNAVRRDADGWLSGALFDGLGLSRALDHLGATPDGRRVLLVGLGGAGVAIAASLSERPLAELALHDRCPGRAAAVAATLQAGAQAPLRALASADPAGFDLIVHATSLGLNADDPLPFDVSRVSPAATVVDILMKPAGTPLQDACRRHGVTVHPGFEMLAQQVPEYLRFFGYEALAGTVAADLEPVRQHLIALA